MEEASGSIGKRSKSSADLRGSPDYMPNELRNFEPTPEHRTPPYSTAADVWSLGSTLVKVLTGHKFEAPNAGPSCEDYVNDLVDGLIDQGATDEVHRVEVLRDVLRMCLKERPSERASVSNIFIIVRAWEGQADFIDLAREVHVIAGEPTPREAPSSPRSGSVTAAMEEPHVDCTAVGIVLSMWRWLTRWRDTRWRSPPPPHGLCRSAIRIS